MFINSSMGAYGPQQPIPNQAPVIATSQFAAAGNAMAIANTNTGYAAPSPIPFQNQGFVDQGVQGAFGQTMNMVNLLAQSLMQRLQGGGAPAANCATCAHDQGGPSTVVGGPAEGPSTIVGGPQGESPETAMMLRRILEDVLDEKDISKKNARQFRDAFRSVPIQNEVDRARLAEIVEKMADQKHISGRNERDYKEDLVNFVADFEARNFG